MASRSSSSDGSNGEADSAIPGEADSVKEDEEVIVDVDDPVFIYSSVGSEGEHRQQIVKEGAVDSRNPRGQKENRAGAKLFKQIRTSRGTFRVGDDVLIREQEGFTPAHVLVIGKGGEAAKDPNESEYFVGIYWYYRWDDCDEQAIKRSMKSSKRELLVDKSEKSLFLSFHYEDVQATTILERITVYYGVKKPASPENLRHNEYYCSFIWDPPQGRKSGTVFPLADDDFKDHESPYSRTRGYASYKQFVEQQLSQKPFKGSTINAVRLTESSGRSPNLSTSGRRKEETSRQVGADRNSQLSKSSVSKSLDPPRPAEKRRRDQEELSRRSQKSSTKHARSQKEETSATKGVLDIAKARCTMDDFHIALDKLESATTKKSDTSVLNQQLAKMKDMKLVAVVLKECNGIQRLKEVCNELRERSSEVTPNLKTPNLLRISASAGETANLLLAKDIQKKWEQTLGKFAAKQDKNTYPGKDYLLEVAEKTRDSVVKSLIDRLTSEVHTDIKNLPLLSEVVWKRVGVTTNDSEAADARWKLLEEAHKVIKKEGGTDVTAPSKSLDMMQAISPIMKAYELRERFLPVPCLDKFSLKAIRTAGDDLQVQPAQARTPLGIDVTASDTNQSTQLDAPGPSSGITLQSGCGEEG